MGHKSLESTMRYLAPATDVHDALDLMTIPSVRKAAPAPRSLPLAKPVLFGREDDRMPAPKGRYRPARYNQVPKHTKPLRMSQRWMRRSEWPRKVAPETIDRRDGHLR
jgi:hypothetical protein